jgi:hypothetical protein
VGQAKALSYIHSLAGLCLVYSHNMYETTRSYDIFQHFIVAQVDRAKEYSETQICVLDHSFTPTSNQFKS